MKRLNRWLVGLVWIGTSAMHAQGLLDELNAVTEAPTLPVRATFKDLLNYPIRLTSTSMTQALFH